MYVYSSRSPTNERIPLYTKPRLHSEFIPFLKMKEKNKRKYTITRTLRIRTLRIRTLRTRTLTRRIRIDTLLIVEVINFL